MVQENYAFKEIFKKGESYLVEQFRQITQSLVEQLRQITPYLVQQFCEIAHYLAEHLTPCKRRICKLCKIELTLFEKLLSALKTPMEYHEDPL